MIIDDIAEILTTANIPNEYYLFKATKNKALPSPPYSIYFIKNEIRRGADNGLLCVISEKHIVIEIYTVKKDDEKIKTIKKLLGEITEFSETVEFDANNEIWITTIEFTAIEKERV